LAAGQRRRARAVLEPVVWLRSPDWPTLVATTDPEVLVRNNRWRVFGLALASIFTAVRLHAQSDKQAVLAVATRFFDGMRGRDSAMMRSTVLPTTVLVIPSGPPGFEKPITIDQFIKMATEGTGPGGDERITNPVVQIDGPMASIWAYYTYTAGGQTAIDHCGIDAFLLQKDHGGWKIFNIAGTIRKTNCTPVSK